MKSLKNHFSVILSLFVLLFSLEFSLMIKRIIKNQNMNLTENYSIVIVSKKELDIGKLKKRIPLAKELKSISSKKILDRLKNDMSSKNLALLKIALPYFYSLKLTKFPNADKVNSIKKRLLKIDGITKVETFSKTHNKMFQLFEIFQTMSNLFSVIIIVLSVLLLFKQIRIWILEHKKKIEIMNYFGASFLMKSSFLYRLVIIDSVISVFLVSVLYMAAPKISIVNDRLSAIGIVLPKFNIISDGLMLLGLSFVLSVLIVTFVAKKMDGK